MEKETDSVARDTTELRVLIREDSHGNLNVEWESRIHGTGVVIPMRSSHVAGQLFSAAFVVLSKDYKSMSNAIGEAVGKGNSKQGKENSG